MNTDRTGLNSFCLTRVDPCPQPVWPKAPWTILPSVRVLLCAAAFAAAVAGCGPPKPRAPVLRAGPVFENDREGFRFLAPTEWALHTRSELPPGRVEKERLLVVYHHSGGDHPAELDVSRIDLPADADLTAFWTRDPRSGVKWKPKRPPESVRVGKEPVTRLTFTGRAGPGPELTNEVVAFRRGDRVYFFAGTFASKDAEAREQIRNCVSSVIWKD